MDTTLKSQSKHVVSRFCLMIPPQLNKVFIEASPFLQFMDIRVYKKRLYQLLILKILICIFNPI